MTKETMKLDDLYPESDAATKRELEGLANSIARFCAVVHSMADRQADAQPVAQQLAQARARRHRAQRRLVLEWAVAAALCVAMLVPGLSYYRNRLAQERAEQAQALRQREADAALLDQVTSEISETAPDAMGPLVEMDVAYTNAQNSMQQREGKNGRTE